MRTQTGEGRLEGRRSSGDRKENGAIEKAVQMTVLEATLLVQASLLVNMELAPRMEPGPLMEPPRLVQLKGVVLGRG